jgi:CRISPR-associated endonuclease/helicase Cas3
MTARELVLWKSWGKFAQSESMLPGGETYHPALFHMFDVGSVAEALLPSLSQGFANHLGVSKVVASRWVSFLIGAHDIGKLHPGFQQKIDDPTRMTALIHSGLPLIDSRDLHLRNRGTNGFDHGLQSVIVMERWLKPRVAPVEIAKPLAHAVGAHHGRFHSGALPGTHRASYGRYDAEGWSSVQDQALEWLSSQFGVEGRLEAEPVNLSALAMALSGFTSLCDWIGSSALDFPWVGDRINSTDYPYHARKCADRAVEGRGFLVEERLRKAFEDPHQSSFARLFPSTPTPRPIQSAVIEYGSRHATRPGLMIVEAPMGEGKTEAALWWAAASQSETCHGVYIALPTQATSNAMAPRLRASLNAVSQGQADPTVHLVHATSSLENERVTPNTHGSEDCSEAIDSEGWFTPRKRTLWATYAVGTVDQALMAALAVKHGFVRLAGLATKAVVIDEVHAYDVYMSTILERLLRWLAELGTPVALLSATLPSARRAALIAAYTGATELDPGPSVYPLVTLAERCLPTEWIEPTASSRSAGVELDRRDDPGDEELAMQALAADLIDQVGAGGCVGWIQNTVDAAQRAFLALQRESATRSGPSVEIYLFHARFRMMDRQRIEARVVDHLGRDSQCRPSRAIVVATQVIEQSLDLDFDLLVSQFAPIDLLLQRLGRLHRHASTSRPPSMAHPRLILLIPRVVGRRPDFGATEYVYDRFVLLKSYLTLEGRTVIDLPDSIRTLVESVYDDRMPDAGLVESANLDLQDFQGAMKRLAEKRSQQIGEAEGRLIKEPHPRTLFYKTATVEFEDRGEENIGSEWIAAVTRLGPPSRSVILLHRRGEELFLEAEGGDPIDLSTRPTNENQRELSLRAVSMSRREVVSHLESFVPPAGLRECAALKYHAILELEKGCWHHPNGRLAVRLDPQLGAVYESIS